MALHASGGLLIARFTAGLTVGAVSPGLMSGAWGQVFVEVPTNGVLKGYIVQDARGHEVCRDRGVWNQFRGYESYIICQ